MARVVRPLRDRQGQPFTGTPEELKRHNAKLYKREQRDAAGPSVTFPTPDGTAAAIARLKKALGIRHTAELITTLIHLADDGRASDSPIFKMLTERTISIGNLEHWVQQLPRHDQADPDDHPLNQRTGE